MSSEPAPRVPKRLAEFEIIRRLGVGGMAEVFLAKKRGAEGTYKVLVVKRVLPQHGSSRRFRSMFAEEAQLATRLNHPNIVQVYEFQDYGDEGQLLSMEYVEGPDLRRLMRSAHSKGARLPPFLAAYVIAEAARGLHYAHERKDEGGTPLEIVHRDVSPQNILLSFDGAIKVADFGIASANLFREEPGVLKGKTGYMSPEQARGDRVNRRTDVYSLGVVFHELLAGRPLHGAAEGQDLLDAVRRGSVEPPSTYAREVPAELEAIAMQALARSPEDRFQTARDMAAAITRALFQRQQVVDAHVLEAAIADLAGREDTSPGVEGPVLSDAGAPSREASESIAQSASSEAREGSEPAAIWREDATSSPGPPNLSTSRSGAGREVRHVVVVRLRIHGLDQLYASRGQAVGERLRDQLKGILDEMAFKRGARWTWYAGNGALSICAQAVVGLTENASRTALDGMRLAVDVHEAIRGACDDQPGDLSVSVGVVRGEASGKRDRAGHLNEHVLREPAGYLAELLSEGAPPGATWVTGVLYRLVRREFVWNDGPSIEIPHAVERSLPRFLQIHSLVRSLTIDERARASAETKGDLVGRDEELGELQSAFHQTTTAGLGTGAGCFHCRAVLGEPGIGKTALVNAFVAELPPGVRIVQLECSLTRIDLPYGLMSDLVRELSGTRGDQPFPEIARAITAVLGEHDSEDATREGGDSFAEMVECFSQLAAGRLVTAVDEADLSLSHRLIAHGLRRLMTTAAQRSPMVVVVDGLAMCDQPSLALIAESARLSPPLPILLILVSRPDDRLNPLVEDLVKLELRGLRVEHQLRLIQTRIGATRGVAQVCADLLPRAGGNPLFLIEMVDALLERGAIELKALPGGEQELVRVERPGETRAALPSTLEQLIADRLNELPPQEREIIDWLAVAGTPLTKSDLFSLMGQHREDAVKRLCSRSLCDLKGEMVDVRHPLTRDVAYPGLEPGVKSRMHLAFGQRLAKTPMAKGLPAALVARHLARGGARVDAANLYLEAAGAAQSSYQLPVAARYYRRAVSLLDDHDLRRLEAHEALEALCRTQGWWKERRRHLAALRRLARASQNPHWVARALLKTARFELDQGLLAAGLSSTQRAESVAKQAGLPMLEVQAQSMMAEVLRDLGDMQGALAACDRALTTGNHPQVASRLRAEVLRARGTLLRRVGRVQEALVAHAEAIAVFKQVGARRMEARAKNSLAFAMFVQGDYEDAIALALEALRIDLAIGGRLQIAKTLSNIGQCYARLGDLPRGLAYLKRARDAHERYGDQDSRAETLLSMAEVLTELGDLEAADTLVGDAGALNAASGSAYDLVHEQLLRALLARAHNDPRAAVQHAFEARQAAEAQAYVAYHFYAMAIEAIARVQIGEQHTGILLATTAVGALEAVQGSEYGVETRATACQALEQAGSPQASEMRRRAGVHAREILAKIRDPEFRCLFAGRPPVRLLLGELRAPPSPTATVGLSGSAGETENKLHDSGIEPVRGGTDPVPPALDLDGFGDEPATAPGIPQTARPVEE